MAEQVWTVGGSSGPLTSNTFNGTSYPELYGRGNLSSHLTQPKSSGYTANRTPFIDYKPGLDTSDNSESGPISQTHVNNQPPILPKRSASLPNISNKPAILHQVRTEYQRQFASHPTASGEQLPPHTGQVSQNHVTTGSEGKNNFTMRHDLWLKTYEEGCRRTAAKVRPNILKPFCRESGFTRGENALLVHPSSLITPQRNIIAQTLKTIGTKDLTGCLRFTTHYMSMFCKQNDWEKSKSRHSFTGVLNSDTDSNTDSGSS